MVVKEKYIFSGHESFFCRSLWLKKGYDFVVDNGDFNDPKAVVTLGVGKNMVASIRYWLRAFGIIFENKCTKLAGLLLNTETGWDPYLEDLGTLWLLHYLLIKTEYATIYSLFFRYFRRERSGEFTKDQLQLFLKRKFDESGNGALYNENTVKRDIGVLLLNYVSPTQSKTNEDYSAILLPLNLVKQSNDKNYFYFNDTAKSTVVPEIFLYSVLDVKKRDKAVSFDTLLDLASIFCMSKTELVDMLHNFTATYPNSIQYSDNSGIRQLLFLQDMDKDDVLAQYYAKL